MEDTDSDQRRESELLAERVDPLAHEVLAAVDPWDAYAAAHRVSGALLHELEWPPHGGAVYVSWARLADVYDTQKTPIPDAHATLREAAAAWLDRSGLPTADFIDRWVERADGLSSAMFLRDGDFWHDPS